MKIANMFVDDINRKISGVIKVHQNDDTTEKEVKEYVVTKELKKHFISFFNYYSDSFREPTDDIGVWISGFFGSGKSHFLKMLAYILENRVVNGIKTVEYFRDKFAEDPATFMQIELSTRGQTEAILFNIDSEGSITKDNTAVLRVFAKMFYNHLGFYGADLKLAMLEHYIEQCGKTEQFRTVFEQKRGESWLEHRRAAAFNGKFIVPTLMEVLDMSEADAKAWLSDKSPVEFSITQLIDDIKGYVSKKPDSFRLLFMIDEVGQYVGTDTSMLLNLQSIVERIGSECGGKVWVACTGQEAIDKIIKVRADEFSRIQARFKTRLSLSSSSVDEVIQKRILRKTSEATKTLENVYDKNDSVLKNLFAFSDSISDIKGYSSASEFAVNFPFVPYQFIIMQKVFAEIRKHGNSGKHLSGGERSMLSGFQEATQKIQDRDEYALIPFFRFYDAVQGFLDSSIRRVIDRCERAADSDSGIEVKDIDILKLLYLLRYIDDIKSNIDNIAILMADDLRADKIALRESVKDSLDRLMNENYIGRSGDTYNFLTDEEQDIQKEIKATNIDTSSVVDKIANIVFGDIYQISKFRYGKNDLTFDRMVDNITIGAVNSGMKLKLLTVAADDIEKSDLRLMTESKGTALVVLADTDYYEPLEIALKIRKYIKQKNMPQLPKSVQDIIKDHNSLADQYEKKAQEELAKAITAARFYVDGEQVDIKGTDAVYKLNQALEQLVMHVYSDLQLITKNIDSDADISAILNSPNGVLSGMGNAEDNSGAAAKVEEYLEMQDIKKLSTSMQDIQSRYQAIPYGWKEIDIAAIVAQLICAQKVTIKYSGTTIQPNNPKLVDMLRKKSEIGRTIVSKRQVPSAQNIKTVKAFLRDYFEIMDIPEDEDGLITFITKRFTEQKEHYEKLLANYTNKRYPDQHLLTVAIKLVDEVLSQQKDNIALIDCIVKKQDALLDSKEDLQGVEGFFKQQVAIFDAAVSLEADLKSDLDYLEKEEEATKALNKIRLITRIQIGKFNYNEIPSLNQLMETVRIGHNRLLVAKQEELLEIVRQCMEAIHTAGEKQLDAKNIITTADAFYTKKKDDIARQHILALLDGLIPPMLAYKDNTCSKIEAMQRPVPSKSEPAREATTTATKKHIRPFNRQVVFAAKRLESEADIDAYVERIRKQLKELLKNCDGIDLQ